MKDMGMTDKQFNGFIRFLIDGLKEAQEEKDADKKNERIQKILDNLQSTLEDQDGITLGRATAPHKDQEGKGK